jgi:hypothetical protein
MANKSVLYNAAGVYNSYNREMLSNCHVVIHDGMIEELIRGELDPADYESNGYEVVDMEGQYLFPGLIDAHAHPFLPQIFSPGFLFSGFRQWDDQVQLNLDGLVEQGVVYAQDMGSVDGRGIRYKGMIDSGELLGPEVDTALATISAKGGFPETAPTFPWPITRITEGNYIFRGDTEHALDFARMMANQGANVLKVYFQSHSVTDYAGPRDGSHTIEDYRRIKTPEVDCITGLIDIAAEKGIRVGVHSLCTEDYETVVRAADDKIAGDQNLNGILRMEHSPAGRLNDNVIGMMVKNQILFSPTLAIYMQSTQEYTQGSIDRLAAMEQGNISLMPEARRQLTARLEAGLRLLKQGGKYKWGEARAGFIDRRPLLAGYTEATENVKRCRDAGVPILFGDDMYGTEQGWDNPIIIEMMEMRRAGYSITDVIHMATRSNAKILGLSGLGSIGKGNKASIIGLSSDGSQNINAFRRDNIQTVMVKGELRKKEGRLLRK